MVVLIWQCKGVPYLILKFGMYDTVIISPSFHCICNLCTDSSAGIPICALGGLDMMCTASTQSWNETHLRREPVLSHLETPKKLH